MATATEVNDVVTALVTVASTVALNDGSFPRVRDLNDTPIQLNQGDCPQVFFLVNGDTGMRIGFNDATGSSKGRRDFEIMAFYVDEAENLGAVWQSRPRVAKWISDLVNKVRTDDTLAGVVDVVTRIVGRTDDQLKYNSQIFRGGQLRIQGFWFS